MIVYVPKFSHNTFEISGYLLYYLHHIVHHVPHKYQLFISWPLVQNLHTTNLREKNNQKKTVSVGCT
jgi:hypothetical protein